MRVERHLPRINVKTMEQHRQSTTLPQCRSRRPTPQHGRCQKGPCHEHNDGRKRDPAPSDVDVSAHLICGAENGNATAACSDRVCHCLGEAITEVWQTGRIFIVEPVEALHDIGSEACLEDHLVSLMQFAA